MTEREKSYELAGEDVLSIQRPNLPLDRFDVVQAHQNWATFRGKMEISGRCGTAMTASRKRI
jgi:hypothetical protein